MKDIIKPLLREFLLAELGNSQILPFEMEDEADSIEQGIPILQEVFFTLKVKNENMLVHFSLEKRRVMNNIVLFDYSFAYVINSGYEKTNDMSTIFPKMTTLFGGIVPAFIKNFNNRYVTKRSNLGTISFIGIGDKNKGENADSEQETKRTKLYTYFATKFKPNGFTMKKVGNEIIFEKIL